MFSGFGLGRKPKISESSDKIEHMDGSSREVSNVDSLTERSGELPAEENSNNDTALTVFRQAALETKPFAIDTFEIGNQRSCMYSWFCPCCALGEARTIVDGSDFYVNSICFTLPATR